MKSTINVCFCHILYTVHYFIIHINALLNPGLSNTVNSVRAQRVRSCLKSSKCLEFCKPNLGNSLMYILTVLSRVSKIHEFVTQKYNAYYVYIQMCISSRNSLFEVEAPFTLTLTLWQGSWFSDFCFYFTHLKSRNKLENICQISCLLISSFSGALSRREEKHPQK